MKVKLSVKNLGLSDLIAPCYIDIINDQGEIKGFYALEELGSRASVEIEIEVNDLPEYAAKG